MLKILSSISVLLFCFVLQAQDPIFYENQRGDKHIAGPFALQTLNTNPEFSTWYENSFEAFEIPSKKRQWTKNLKDVEVTIYMGTWCGDSKYWVPKFVKAWGKLGLDPNKLKFVGLYGGGPEGLYKQGPNHEEQGKRIHRVPTFIFEKDNNEIARIVESPVNDLMTDIAQIALGYPSEPNYRAANYLMAQFDEGSTIEISELYSQIRRMAQGTRELNTLGYVYLHANRVDEAVKVFELNKMLNPFDHNVYDSYAEALAKKGENRLAIENYERVLLLDRFNTNAREQLERLRE